MFEEWIYGVIILSVFFFVAYSMTSNLTTKTGAMMETTGKIAKLTGKIVQAASDTLITKSVEREFNKISLGGGFNASYQAPFEQIISTITIYLRMTTPLFRKNELTENQLAQLLIDGSNYDNIMANKIYTRSDFYQVCKKLEIARVIIKGCYINALDATLKESATVCVYIVGDERLEPLEVENKEVEPYEVEPYDSETLMF
jgi:hypothetical protein